MHQPHHQGSLKSAEQQENRGNQGSSSIGNEAYNGEYAEFGYAQAIFDLLKEPVSLGMRGASGHRGRQR